MSKIDKVKEVLNTIRVSLSISFAMLALVITGLIKRYDSGRVDELFWFGILAAILIIFFIFALIIRLAKRTNEIEEL